MPNLTHYLTRAQAAELLGVSEKTVQRLVRVGKLPQLFRPQNGKPPEAVYNPVDLQRIKAEIPPPLPQPQPRPKARHQPAAVPVPDIPLTEKIWLTMRETAALTGLPMAVLKRSRDERTLPAAQFGRTWRVHRPSLMSMQQQETISWLAYLKQQNLTVSPVLSIAAKETLN